LCSAAGWHNASAREIVSHWRRTGRYHDPVDVDGEQVVPVPREQLSLLGVQS
jgi:hypothetical protein